LLVEVAELVGFLLPPTEVGAVTVVDKREDAAAHRHPRLVQVTGSAPRCAELPDLLGLLFVERLAALIELKRRALQVHAESTCPTSRGVGRRSPPDALPQALRVGLYAQ